MRAEEGLFLYYMYYMCVCLFVCVYKCVYVINFYFRYLKMAQMCELLAPIEYLIQLNDQTAITEADLVQYWLKYMPGHYLSMKVYCLCL